MYNIHNKKIEIVDIINYDILQSIIEKLELNDIINFIFSFKKIYRLYKINDKNYGCYKIANIIINKSVCLFKINDIIKITPENKESLCNSFIKLYKLFKNCKKYNSSDILVSMMENNIKSNEIFRCFCLKSKYYKNMEKYKECKNIQNYTQYKSIVRYINYESNFIFRNYEKNIISNSDMKYMIVNIDKCKLQIILKTFFIETNIISLCINDMLKYKKKDYSIKIKICIDYIFLKYCFKEISEDNKRYFIDIFTCFIFYNETHLLKYFETKFKKYLQLDIFNNITQIMYNKNYNNNNLFNLF